MVCLEKNVAFYEKRMEAIDKAHHAFFPPHLKRFRKGCAIVARQDVQKLIGKVSKMTLRLVYRERMIIRAREGAFQVAFKG